MSEENKIPCFAIAEKLVKLSGYLFVVLAAVFNEFLLAMLDSNPTLNHVTVMTVRSVQVTFAIIGIALFAFAYIMRKARFVRTIFEKPASVKILLFILTLAVPLTII